MRPKYDLSTSNVDVPRIGKVRKTLTLDPDVIAALGDDPALSTTVNAILLQEIARRESRLALGRSWIDWTS